MTEKCISDVEAAFARRHDNGADYWASADGRLGVGDPFSTIKSLLILHELKVTRTHEAIRCALDLVLGACRDDGRYRAKDDRRCLEALRALESKLDSRGRVVVERPHRKLAALHFCAQGQPSELATSCYRDILKNLRGENE